MEGFTKFCSYNEAVLAFAKLISERPTLMAIFRRVKLTEEMHEHEKRLLKKELCRFQEIVYPSEYRRHISDAYLLLRQVGAGAIISVDDEQATKYLKNLPNLYR